MKFLILLFASFIFSFSFAQPANNLCSGAITHTPNGSCLNGTTVSATDTWQNTVGCQNGNNNSNHPEVWYTFVPTGSQAQFTVTSSSPFAGNVEIILVQGTCNTGFTLNGSQCGASPLSTTFNGLITGQTYYYTISNASGGTQGPFQTCLTTVTPPTSSGQDCGTAAILCDNSSFGQGSSTAGAGSVFGNSSNENLSALGCLLSDERQSRWYKFTVGCSGTIEFLIDPVTNSNDYDWAVYNITTSGCILTPGGSAVGGATQVACNYSGCPGNTGIVNGTAAACALTNYLNCAGGPASCDGGDIAQFLTTPPTLVAGNVYAMVIDNFSLSNSGFNFSWGNGTAVIGPDAAFTYTNPSCGVFNFTKTCQTTNSTFLWSFGDGGTSNLQNPSYTYSTTGTYTVVLQVTDALGCIKTFSTVININFPVASATPNPATICSGSATNIVLSSTVGGTTYSWVATDNVNVTGESLTPQSTATIINTLTNNTTVSQIVNYTVTPTAAGCVGPNLNVQVTVNPRPTISPMTATICSTGTFTTTPVNVTNGVVPAGTTYTWTAPSVTGGVTGGAAGSGASITGTLTNPTSTAQTATYTVTPTAGGCPGPTFTVTVTVNPIPTITGTLTICVGSTSQLTGSGTANPISPWISSNTTVASVNSSGLVTANNTGSTTITYTNDSGCYVDVTFTVTTNILPTFTQLGPYCQCATPDVLQTTSTNGITGIWSPSTISTATSGTTVYTFTSNTGQCALDASMSVDINPITVSMPSDDGSIVACLSAATAPTTPTVIDNCGNTLTVSAPVISAAPSCSGTQTYTYTYTSCTGSTYPWVYTYTISAPTVTMPPNDGSSITCYSLATTPTTPTVIDNCGNTLTVSAPVISAAPACSGTQTYTYTYTSCSGSTYPWVYTYTINDNIFPTASNPSDIVVSGGTAPAPDPLVVIDEADNCSIPTVAWLSDLSDNGVCPETITRTYSVTDACGNQILVTQLLIIGDAIIPTASNPLPINVECIGDVPIPDVNVVTDEADNGATPTVTFEDDSSDGNTCPQTILRRYRVTDDCGNFIFVTQTITINDITAPTASNPIAINVQCNSDVPASDVSVVLDEADNCTAIPIVTFIGDVSNGNTCPEIITRTYRITDDCGNFTNVTQTITVHDTQAPVFSAPPTAVAVQCSADVPAMINLAYTDNCDAPGVVTGTDVSNGLTCPETITRTWTRTDACGNTASVTQTITVHDTQAPVFAAAPAAISVQCAGDVPAMTNLAYTDNCAAPGVVTGTDSPLSNPCGGIITRTWTFTDACGNTATATQTITVNDNTPPTASNPAPISVVSASTVPAPNVLVVIDEADNCTVNPVVAWVSDVSDGNTCNNETITRTYSITDNCGNQSTVTQLITITAAYPIVNAGLDQSLCEGQNVVLTATSNIASSVISWSSSVINSQAFLSPMGTTVYTATANNYGCIATDNVSVTVNSNPVVSFNASNLMGCEPLDVVFTNTTTSANAISNCVWNFGNGTTLNGCGPIEYLYLNPGLYDVTLTTTDVNGCTNSFTANDYIYVEATPTADFTASDYTLNNLSLSTPINFTNESVGANSYLWSFGDNSTSTSENPTHNFESVDATSFVITLIATSPLGCTDVTYQTITVSEELVYYIPNTFTPDGDSHNNTFQPVFTSGFDPYSFTMLIFNRWGETIFETHNADIGWDGTYNGEYVQDGTYTWKIEFKSRVNDKRYLKIGHVNMLR